MTEKRRAGSRRTICVVSSHPLVLRDVGQALSKTRFRLRVRKIEGSPTEALEGPARAPIYVVDGQLPPPTAETVVGSIASRFPKSRVLVVAERFPEADAFGLLRLGVKGLVRYEDLQDKLPLAVDTVAAGGFWAPRALLSRFLDELVARAPRRRLAGSHAGLSGREKEVLGLVLENLSNKEIAARLHISERTVKFHVSNLLAKFHLKSRQELILHCLSAASRGS